jgi:predicted membrane channel-forming protein YqfA (hemolysin III family)
MEYLTDPIYLKNFHSTPWALGGAIYIFGACLYMLKIPERFKPGYFDIVVRNLVLLRLI